MILSTTIKILDEARMYIQANMAQPFETSKGTRWINASGRSSEAFRVEVSGSIVRLVYRGDDVAPLESIERGSQSVPSLEEANQWRTDKMKSGAIDVPNAESIVRGIEERGGTERYYETQEWIITPVIETAVQALNDQLPREAVREIKEVFFRNN